MQIAILQSAGEHPENYVFREALCLQRAFTALGYISHVRGPGFAGDLATAGECDLCIVLENYWRTPWLDTLKAQVIDRGVRCAFWSIDAHVPAAAARHVQLVHEQKIPLVFCSTPATRPIFDAMGVRTEWLPNAYDDTLLGPVAGKEHDAGFCGRLIAGRGGWLADVSRLSGVPVHVDEWVLGHAMVAAQSSYRVGLNRAYSIDINYRCFEVCGCRTALLTNEVHGLKDVLRPGEHCVTYRSTEECAEKLKNLARDPQTAELIAYRAWAHVQENHTYRNRARTILERML